MSNAELSFAEANATSLAEIAQLVGVGVEDVFLYSEHPTKTSGRWVFQSWIDGVPGAKRVCLSLLKATANVAAVLWWCRTHPDEARALTENYRP